MTKDNLSLPLEGDPSADEELTKKVNVIPLLIIAESHPNVALHPKLSPRIRPLSESSEAEHQQTNGNHHFDLGNSYLELDENNLSVLPENDFQSTYSINDYQGYQIRGDVVVDQLPIPPDGGYGWVIVAAAFVCNFIVDGISNAFGPFMSSYQEAFGVSKAAVSLIGSLLIGTYLLSGPIAGGLLNNYETRKVVIGGTIVASAAFALSAFSPNIFVHYFLYGILGGIGFGFVYLPAIVVVSQYFEAKRALATGISVAGSGLGTFVLPQLAKFLIESFGWKVALCAMSSLILICALCGLLFRPLEMPEFDTEKQNKLNEALKQQALLAALSRADGDELQSNASESAETMAGGISPLKRSATTRSSQCTKEDGQPLLNGIEIGGLDSPREAGTEEAPSPPTTPHRPPLSPIPESAGPRRLSKSRAGSQHQPHMEALAGRHPTMTSNRTRKPTLASVISDMGSTNQLRYSRANLNSQLSRVSARSYAQSLSRISQVLPGQSIKGGESVLSVAALTNVDSTVDSKEFARPLSRHDIFLQGSIRNLREFESEGGNYQRYRESQTSIPMVVAAQNFSSSLSHAGGNMIEANHRFGGSQYSRITEAFGVAECEEIEPCKMATKFSWIPYPIWQAFSEMLSLSLLTEPVMLLLSLANILGMLGFYVPFVFLIDLATARGATLSEATFLLSLIGIANTFGRVFFGWLADQRWLSALAINNFSLISCGLLTILCPMLPNYMMLISYAILFGFIVAAYICLTSIVLSDLLGIERLTNSFGILVVARGIASLLGTPMAGIVFDLTQSYDASFYFAGILILLAGLVCCAVAFVHRYQRSQLRNEGDYVEPEKKLAPIDQLDAQSGKLSVLTERSEENLTEYQRTIQSLHQQRALLQELEQYRQRNEVVDEADDGQELHDEAGSEQKEEEAAQDADGHAESAS